MDKHHLSNRLPVHTPDEGLWNAISSELERIGIAEKYEARMAGLPVHSPDERLWPAILSSLRWAGYRKIGWYTALTAAASLLILFTFLRFQPSPKGNTNQVAVSEAQHTSPKPVQASENKGTTIGSSTSAQEQERPVQANMSTGKPSLSPGIRVKEQIIPDEKVQLAVMAEKGEPYQQIRPLQPRTFAVSVRNARLHPKGGAKVNTVIPVMTATNPPKKYYTPDPYTPNAPKSSNFTLAANYLPESLENGNGTSLFHNFGLMASVGNDKNRIQSSVGMAYNAEHRIYDVNYTQHITITVANPGSTADSTIVLTSERDSQLEGTERHQYFTYDLGFGRKVFSIGKMTTWINTGAGLAVKLDHSSLKETTIKTINSYNNSELNDINLEIPDYNGFNLNLMAGLDFNYRVLDKLSISFAPISRFYLKPVLEKNGVSTDSFSLGFRSGVKLDF